MKKIDKLIQQTKSKIEKNDVYYTRPLTYEQIDAEIQKLNQEFLKFTREEQLDMIEDLRKEKRSPLLTHLALEVCDDLMALMEEVESKELRLCDEENR